MIDLDGHLHGVDPGNSPCIRTDEHIIDLSLYNQAIFLQLRSEFPDPHFQSGAPAANAAKPDAETGAGSAKTAPPRSDSRAPLDTPGVSELLGHAAEAAQPGIGTARYIARTAPAQG